MGQDKGALGKVLAASYFVSATAMDAALFHSTLKPNGTFAF